jgi:Fe2+ transport system protein B
MQVPQNAYGGQRTTCSSFSLFISRESGVEDRLGGRCVYPLLGLPIFVVVVFGVFSFSFLSFFFLNQGLSLV